MSEPNEIIHYDDCPKCSGRGCAKLLGFVVICPTCNGDGISETRTKQESEVKLCQQPTPQTPLVSNAGPESDPQAPAETRSFEDVYRVQTSEIERLSEDLKTAQLNASAAVKLAQDREKEVTDFRMLLNEVREERDASLNRITELESERENLSIGREWQRMVKELAEARQRIEELESIAYVTRPGMEVPEKTWAQHSQDILRMLYTSRDERNEARKERDALKAELETLRNGTREWGKLADYAKAELDACKRERDEARECARKESDLRHAQVEKLESEARRYRKVIDEQKEQLTDKSALCERLKETAKAALDTFRNEGEGPARCRKLLTELLQRAEGQP